MRTPFVALAAALSLLVALNGCDSDADPSPTADSTGPPVNEAPAHQASGPDPVDRIPADAQPEIVTVQAQEVSAPEFFSAYKDDEATAVAKYRQGPIEITGIVKSVDRNSYFDEGLKPQIALAGIEEFDPDSVADRRNCTHLVHCFLDEPTEPWKVVCSGSEVTIRGVLLDPSGRNAQKSMIGHGRIVSAEGAPTPHLSIDQFVAECNQDRNASDKKYLWKSMIIDGRVEAIEELGSGGVRAFTLQGSVDERIRVELSLGVVTDTQVAIGDNVAALGICTTRFSDPDQFATLITSTILPPSELE